MIGSKLIGRQGNDFQIYLRLRKKKIITVILDTDHDVHYFAVNPWRWACHSRTTRISEVEDAGKPTENVRPPDTGHGFLWRLNSYWRFEAADGGVYAECEAISLSRDVPLGLGWMIKGLLEKFPKQSMQNTLRGTKAAVEARSSP